MNVGEQTQLGPGSGRARNVTLVMGAACIVVAILSAIFIEHSAKRFFFAYLVSFAFFLTISLGAIFFVLIQHLTRAGWSVGVRRIGETLAALMPVLAVLSLPILISVGSQSGNLYRWAQAEQTVKPIASPGEAGHAVASSEQVNRTQPVVEQKRAWLNPARFISFVVAYFVVWSAIGVWYWRKSVEQDLSGDLSISSRMQAIAPAALLALGITLTFGAFDLFMSLDPAWFSTIFGVYVFSGSAVAIFATIIIIVYLLQRAGYLSNAVTIEHYHDLGKFLFGFTFFWGYIAFSQYMLLWYANIPETSEWFARRGATTVLEDVNGWSDVSLILLFGQLLIPFAGMMSRHVKRKKGALVFWAAWLLVFHWIDLYWLVMPELDGRVQFGLIEVACFVGVGGIYVGALLAVAMRHAVRPIGDPRRYESIAFENV